MNARLWVDPAHLRAAAAAQVDLAASVAGLGAGATMTSAGADVAGLTSADACSAVAKAVEDAVSGVRDDLSSHSKTLSTAADHYDRADAELGTRLRRIRRMAAP